MALGDFRDLQYTTLSSISRTSKIYIFIQFFGQWLVKKKKMYTTFPAANVELNRFETAALRMNVISNILVNILL